MSGRIACARSALNDARAELIVNLSQLQKTPDARAFENLQHRLADRVFLRAALFFENVRALITTSVTAQDGIFLPWGNRNAIFPLVAAEDIARAAAALLADSGPSATSS